MLFGPGILLNGVISSRAKSRGSVVAPNIDLRLAGPGASADALGRLVVTSPSGYSGASGPVVQTADLVWSGAAAGAPKGVRYASGIPQWFRGALPAATNLCADSRGPASVTGWTITNVPGIMPAGARHFHNDSGYIISCYDLANAPSQFYLHSAIVEKATADYFAISIYDTSISNNIALVKFRFFSGTIEGSSGNYAVELLANSGPNGGKVYRASVWIYAYTAGGTLRMFIYPTADPASAKATFVHHLECRSGPTPAAAGVTIIGGVPRLDGLIATDGAQVTRLAETITTPTWTPSASLSVVLDLAIDALPTADTVLLSRSGFAVSLLADGRLRVTDGTTTVTSTAAVTAGGVRKVGFAAGASSTRLRVHDTIETLGSVLNSGSIDRLDYGYAPWGSFDRTRIWLRQLGTPELASV